MVKHSGRENQAPQTDSVPSAGFPAGLWFHQNASPAAASAGETSAGWGREGRKQDLIQHVTAGCTLSRDPRQAENIPLGSATYQI